MKIENILVPLDGSKNSAKALDVAIYLSTKCDAKIIGVYVLPFPGVQAYKPNKAAQEVMYEEGKRFLRAAEKSVTQKGISFQKKILKGHQGDAITDFAGSKKIDLIVMGSRGRSGLKEKFLGSVSNYVMHKSNIPILIVK